MADISSDGERGPNTLGLIICNKEFNYLHNQNGSELDLLGMQDLLENLGYSVVIKENLTAQMVLGLFGSPLTVEKPVQIHMVGSCKVTSVMMLLQRLMWKRTSLLSNLPHHIMFLGGMK
ncbi:LOW QUALITY PROTEIN: CASP12 isoform 6 [Pongo abelii]|uniref:CASP12 isoform 6 n=1 Tax=Pongo abelii TaxID=9601 RepID=A0A2J8XXA5_PONAB|nr:LOW QUALITY PROTEIN: CASP12 isoform 6 [Pongo abelii]